jgi:hypothetical protein
MGKNKNLEQEGKAVVLKKKPREVQTPILLLITRSKRKS